MADGPLSKQELFWLEITGMAERLEKLAKTINASEKNVGNTATSIEESLSSMREQLEVLVGAAEGLMGKKEMELQKRIDAALAETQDAVAKRDLEVIDTITEGVKAEIDSSLAVVVKTLKDSTDDTIGRIRVAAVQSVNSTRDTGRFKWLAWAAGAVVVLMLVGGGGVWWVASTYYDQRVRELGFGGAEAAAAAVKLSKFNDLPMMADCVGFQTHKQNGHVYCVPMDKDKVVSGWRVE